jgi:hypothetical protein
LEALSRPSVSPADEEEAWAQKKAVHAAEWAEWRKWNEENEAFAARVWFRGMKRAASKKALAKVAQMHGLDLAILYDPPCRVTTEMYMFDFKW